jgi:hypothetical protein
MLGRMSDHATAQRKTLLLYGATAFSKILSRIVGAASRFSKHLNLAKLIWRLSSRKLAQSRATRAPAAPKFPKTLAENIASS